MDEAHALSRVHEEVFAVLLLGGRGVNVQSRGGLEKRREHWSAGGRVLVGERVLEGARIEPGEGVGDGGRVAALLEDRLLPELRGPRVTCRDEAGAEERADRAQRQRGGDAAPVG